MDAEIIRARNDYEDRKKQELGIRRSIRTLDSFRTACLLGEAPAWVTVDGFTFKDELEAEGYLVELGYALDAVWQDREPDHE